jgi:imidazolonepropionase-like amidohydrolase
MKSVIKSFWGMLAIAALLVPLMATAQDAPKQILFTNVNVFDGFGPELQMGMNVLVEDNYIKQVSAEPISAAGATVIDGAGRTMTPGFIDMHQHVMLNPPEGTAAYQTRWDDAAGGAMAIHNMNERDHDSARYCR